MANHSQTAKRWHVTLYLL